MTGRAPDDGVGDCSLATRALIEPLAQVTTRAVIDTQGYVVRDGGRRGREWLARVRGLAEATLRPDVIDGPPIPITGDGRASWSDTAGRAHQARAAGGA